MHIRPTQIYPMKINAKDNLATDSFTNEDLYELAAVRLYKSWDRLYSRVSTGAG